MRALMSGLRRNKAPGKADPAPSRLKYRVQRWMLTPGIRTGLKFGVPLALVALATGAYLADEDRRKDLVERYAELRSSIEQRPEFMVNAMAIDGAAPDVGDDIREVVALSFPISSFDLDIEQLRAQIIELDPVKTAEVRIRPGGILQVDVLERKPAAVWRSDQGLALIDETGAHVAELGQRGLHPTLPLLAGAGADHHVEEALELISTAKPLGLRLRGLVRIGERRWDVVLDRDQRIQLPPLNPVQALERVIAVNQVQDLLERDVAVVDMRLAARPTVRMAADAVENWWQTRELNGGG